MVKLNNNYVVATWKDITLTDVDLLINDFFLYMTNRSLSYIIMIILKFWGKNFEKQLEKNKRNF